VIGKLAIELFNKNKMMGNIIFSNLPITNHPVTNHPIPTYAKNMDCVMLLFWAAKPFGTRNLVVRKVRALCARQ
jgi:hypothetical protein